MQSCCQSDLTVFFHLFNVYISSGKIAHTCGSQVEKNTLVIVTLWNLHSILTSYHTGFIELLFRVCIWMLKLNTVTVCYLEQIGFCVRVGVPWNSWPLPGTYICIHDDVTTTESGY